MTNESALEHQTLDNPRHSEEKNYCFGFDPAAVVKPEVFILWEVVFFGSIPAQNLLNFPPSVVIFGWVLNSASMPWSRDSIIRQYFLAPAQGIRYLNPTGPHWNELGCHDTTKDRDDRERHPAVHAGMHDLRHPQVEIVSGSAGRGVAVHSEGRRSLGRRAFGITEGVITPPQRRASFLARLHPTPIHHRNAVSPKPRTTPRIGYKPVPALHGTSIPHPRPKTKGGEGGEGVRAGWEAIEGKGIDGGPTL
ncbi:hypothetical protein B0H13DRAFT_1894219 [Mycena leptocephala]|nr:hypothetical protein B0H13DRAFT_1894219 [Mycena leptocephala]